MPEGRESQDRYFSNEWIKPIQEDAKPIFKRFDRGTAIEVASAVLKGVDKGNTEIPWVTVFPSDDKHHVGERLLNALRAPDYKTPAYNPETHLAVEEVRQLLADHEAFGLQGKHAAYFLVRTAAGKEDEMFATYQDMGRKWPQYATTWIDTLKGQFGDEGYEEMRTVHPEFAELLGETAAIADLHYQQQGRTQQPGESATNLIQRTAQLFDITSVGGLQEANRMLGDGLKGYRKAAYHIRGLPEPTPPK